VSGTLGIVLFVVALLLAILIHEAAHYGVAKAFRIKVEEFFVGFGPRLWSFRRGETEYGVKALPLGGYVKIAGMNPYEEVSPEDYPRTYGARPPWQRALVIVAGPATHFVIAFFLLTAYSGLVNQQTSFQTVIAGVQKTMNGRPSPAAVVGIKRNDVVVAVDRIRNPSDDGLREYTKEHRGTPIHLELRRGDGIVRVTVTPVYDPKLKFARIGVVIASEPVPGRAGFFGSFADGGKALGIYTVDTVKSLGRVFGPSGIGRVFDELFGGAPRSVEDPTTVIGASRVAGQVPLHQVVLLLALVNIVVGIINLVPLPPFDGGHLAVVVVEKVRGKKVDMRKLIPVTVVVAGFLVIWFLSVGLLDILKPLPMP
jgi:membrane-associated protease RseP (regulator of RpoE activity)